MVHVLPWLETTAWLLPWTVLCSLHQSQMFLSNLYYWCSLTERKIFSPCFYNPSSFSWGVEHLKCKKSWVLNLVQPITWFQRCYRENYVTSVGFPQFDLIFLRKPRKILAIQYLGTLSVLGLAGPELIFIAVAGRELCFGFLLNTGLIIPKCSCYCQTGLHCARVFYVFHFAVLVRKVGRKYSWERWPLWPEEYSRSWDIMLTICTMRGRRRKWGPSRVVVFVFPSHCYVRWGPALLEMDEQLPELGNQRIHSLFCFACVFSVELSSS